MRSLAMLLAAALLGLAISGVCALGQSRNPPKEKDKAKGGESTRVPPPPPRVVSPYTPPHIVVPPYTPRRVVPPHTPPRIVVPPRTAQTDRRRKIILASAVHATQGKPKNPHIVLGKTAPSGKTTKYTLQELIINNSTGLQSDQEKGAFNKLLSGAPLSSADRQILANTLVSGRQLNPDVRDFITLGLNSPDPGSDPNSTLPRQTRYLRLRNGTQEPLTIWLRFYTLTDEQSWVWFPWDPMDPSKALTYQLAPDEVTYLKHEGAFISGSNVRLWAQSESKQWLDYRDRDLWLVPEVDERGQHYYFADKKETYSFAFN